jgi:hypothetical protein
LGNLNPAYVRGEAYLAARQGREAAAEFQKFSTIAGVSLAIPSAHWHIFKSVEHTRSLATQPTKAAYNDFLTLWKDADPDLPILKQAKAEYAKLQ